MRLRLLYLQYGTVPIGANPYIEAPTKIMIELWKIMNPIGAHSLFFTKYIIFFVKKPEKDTVYH